MKSLAVAYSIKRRMRGGAPLGKPALELEEDSPKSLVDAIRSKMKPKPQEESELDLLDPEIEEMEGEEALSLPTDRMKTRLTEIMKARPKV